MNTGLYTLLCCMMYNVRCSPLPHGNNTEKQLIQQLEEKSAKLLKQINVAVDDSIRTLQNSNDSDAQDGLEYMKLLKEQLGEFNVSDTNSNETDLNEPMDNDILTSIISNSSMEGDGRRKYYDKNDRIKHILVEYSKLAVPPSGQGNVIIESAKKLDKVRNRLEIEKKLGIWLKQREKEKQLIKAYKNKIMKPSYGLNSEKCPNFGIEKGYKKYPCCRKCCKTSYLGCLK